MSFSLQEEIKSKLLNNQDFVARKIKTVSGEVLLFFLKSMVDKASVSKEVIEPILNHKESFVFDDLLTKIISSADAKEIKKEEIVDEILKNHIVLAFNDQFLTIDLEKVPHRTPTEPPTSPNIYGPREGFIEEIGTNISMIRRRLPTAHLKMENFNIGRETKTKVCMLYLKNVANKEVIKEIKNRLKQIDIDGILDTYYIAEFLKKRPYSLFEQTGFQEKPDIVVAKVLEGRVAILVDGSPIVLTLPYMVFEDLQSSNDYYTNYIYVGMIRIIRTLGILVSTIVPGLYLSIRLYSYTTLPLSYIIIISNSTNNLPFTPVLEIIFILVLFQIWYEVSLRLPQYLGLATSIVGALVLGDTAVKAGLISPPGVIIVAVSIMAIYTIPSLASQLTVLRAVFVILGSCLGLLGIVGGLIYVINYINSLNYYGTPFLAPISPQVGPDLKDGFFKSPLTQITTRPASLNVKNKTRQSGGGKNEQWYNLCPSNWSYCRTVALYIKDVVFTIFII